MSVAVRSLEYILFAPLSWCCVWPVALVWGWGKRSLHRAVGMRTVLKLMVQRLSVRAADCVDCTGARPYIVPGAFSKRLPSLRGALTQHLGASAPFRQPPEHIESREFQCARWIRSGHSAAFFVCGTFRSLTLGKWSEREALTARLGLRLTKCHVALSHAHPPRALRPH